MKKGLNLIIDGNYLLIRGIYILLKSRTIEQDLVPLLARDIKKITELYNFDNIYFCSDSGTSWRKEFLDNAYKANRKKDESIDWDMCFREYTDFKESLSKVKGIKVLEFPKLEGDDIISYLIRKGNKLGYSNFVVCRDQDIQQHAEFSIEDKYTNVIWNYNKASEKLFVPNNFDVFEEMMRQSADQATIFETNNDREVLEMFEKVAQSASKTEVLGEEILFTKIITGDSGDNIPGIIKLKAGKLDPTGRGIGEAGAKKCYIKYKEVYPEIIDFNGEEFITRCTSICALSKKVKDDNIKEVMSNNIRSNIKLIKLDDINIPSELLKVMTDNVLPLLEKKDSTQKEGFWFDGAETQEKISSNDSMTLQDIISPRNKGTYDDWKHKNTSKNNDACEEFFGSTDTEDLENDFWTL